MRHIRPTDSDYLSIYNKCAQMWNPGKEFPDDVFRLKDTSYMYSYFGITYNKESLSFFELLCEFLRNRQQSHFYILPLSIDMTMFEFKTQEMSSFKKMDIIQFYINDMPSAYDAFWHSPKDITEDYLMLPDSLLICDESNDWFVYESHIGMSMALYGLSVSNLADFKEVFNPSLIEFCSEDEILSEAKYSYTEKGFKDFNKWIKPHLVYLKENEEED